MSLKPLWKTGVALPTFAPLGRNLTVDAAVIGAGITGITTALLLKSAGLKVALLERHRCGGVDTAHTTAHLTFVTDARLTRLVRTFGRDHAQALWHAVQSAINQIDELVGGHAIDCAFRRVPGYLHAPLEGGRHESRRLEREARLAAELGFPAAFDASAPLVGRPAIRLANQAKFHPLRYLAGLLPLIPGRGSAVFEHTDVEEIADADGGAELRARGQTLRCRWLIIATHVPLVGKTNLTSATLFQTKLASYSSYVVAARLPRGRAPEASFWDTSDPYYYLRIDAGPRFDTAILGGLDHKTGQETDSESRFARLEALLLRLLPEARLTARWSGQVVETPDRLPYIGTAAPHQFISTGFGGNGMTFGTLAAMMARDAVLARRNPWAELFAVDRKPVRGPWNYLRENLDYPYYLLKDRLTRAQAKSPRSLSPGQGAILRVKGQTVAVYRGPTGKITRLSPICTHMGCQVEWNGSESTWDCPCHGSRFKPDGQVLAGPAETAMGKPEK